MYTVRNTQPSLINLTPDLKEFEFNLEVAELITQTTKIGVIPNPLFKLKLQEWRKRDLQREREIEIKKQKIDKLPWEVCSDFEKEAIKSWIDKDKGYFKVETYQKYINTIHKIENEINDIWDASEIEGDPGVFWTKKDGDRCLFTERVKIGKVYRRNIHDCKHYTEPQEIHDRNYAIGEIRNQYDDTNKEYRFIKFVGGGSYENKGAWIYKSKEAEQGFRKEVEQKDLVKKVENKQLGTGTKQLITKPFELGLIKGINAEGLEEDNFYSFRDLNRFQKDEVLD